MGTDVRFIPSRFWMLNALDLTTFSTKEIHVEHLEKIYFLRKGWIQFNFLVVILLYKFCDASSLYTFKWKLFIYSAGSHLLGIELVLITFDSILRHEPITVVFVLRLWSQREFEMNFQKSLIINFMKRKSIFCTITFFTIQLLKMKLEQNSLSWKYIIIVKLSFIQTIFIYWIKFLIQILCILDAHFRLTI